MEDASRYEVTETIATGEFAVVLRARDRKLDRDVVLKQIRQPYLAAERQLARYWKEMQLLAALRHPNLLTIYDIVQPKGFVVLELMRESLLPATQTAGIDLELVRAALSGCLTALEFLHAKGIRHGDVKPGNMLVDNEGRVKLADFGYFRHPLTQNGELLKGTPKYMAPELLSTQFGRARGGQRPLFFGVLGVRVDLRDSAGADVCRPEQRSCGQECRLDDVARRPAVHPAAGQPCGGKRS